MINSIVRAAAASLTAAFGDACSVCVEERGQEPEKPCLLISCVDCGEQLFRGGKYFRKNRFCMQYFPGDNMQRKEACNEAADRLFSCLAQLAVEGETVTGTEMRCEMADGVLKFYVNYNLFVYREADPFPLMEELERNVSVKGR